MGTPDLDSAYKKSGLRHYICMYDYYILYVYMYIYAYMCVTIQKLLQIYTLSYIKKYILHFDLV